MRVRRLTGSRNGCPPHARACPSLARGGVTTRPATSRRQTLRRSGPLQAEGPQIFPSARPRPSTPLGPPPILPSVPARHGPDHPPAGTTDAGIRGPTLGVAGASDDIDDRGTIVRDAPPRAATIPDLSGGAVARLDRCGAGSEIARDPGKVDCRHLGRGRHGHDNTHDRKPCPGFQQCIPGDATRRIIYREAWCGPGALGPARTEPVLSERSSPNALQATAAPSGTPGATGSCDARPRDCPTPPVGDVGLHGMRLAAAARGRR
jgi:hypothetical protein